MKLFKLCDMTKGWFVGGFEPSAFYTDKCEVAFKSYSSGDVEPKHFHAIATEITLIVSGRVEMSGREFKEGDIVVLEPGEISSFNAITDVLTVVVKSPSVKNDKYLAID